MYKHICSCEMTYRWLTLGIFKKIVQYGRCVAMRHTLSVSMCHSRERIWNVIVWLSIVKCCVWRTHSNRPRSLWFISVCAFTVKVCLSKSGSVRGVGASEISGLLVVRRQLWTCESTRYNTNNGRYAIITVLYWHGERHV